MVVDGREGVASFLDGRMDVGSGGQLGHSMIPTETEEAPKLGWGWR